MRHFILIVAGATFFHLSVTTVAISQATNDRDMLRDRVQKWMNWSQEFGISTVAVDTGKLQDGKPFVNRRTIQRKLGGYRRIRAEFSSGDRMENHVAIQNPSYSAGLAIGLNNEWALTGLAVAGEPDYEKRLADVIGGVDYFDTKIVNTGAQIIPLALDQAGYTMPAVEEIGEATVYTLEFKKGHHTVPPNFSMVRLHFSKSGLAPPVQIDYAFATRNVSRVFRDWTKAGGKDVPTKDLQYSPEFMSSGMTPTDTATFDYTNFDAPFDTATCYLTHYGLPEPSQVSGSGMSLWILAGVGVILVIVGFVVRQRRAAAD